jgi:hypothetical protein
VKLNRQYETFDGKIRFIPLEICRCGADQRGPIGGVCGACGNAIPNRMELDRLNRMEDVMMADPKYDPNQPKEPKKEDETKKKPDNEDEEEEETERRQEQEPARR